MNLRRRVLGGAAIAVATCLAASAGAGAVADDSMEITAVDASAYPTVAAVVTARLGLTDAASITTGFEVLEAGVPVDARVERLSAEQLEVMLLVDTSKSMEGEPLDSVKAAANEFVALLPPEVSVGVVAYGTTPQLVTAPTTDRDVIAAGIAPLVAATDTALYDAVIYANQHFTADSGQRAMVLVTDGEDNASRASLEEASAVAETVPVHVIELVTERSDPTAITWLSAVGGGTISAADDPGGLAELYRRTAGALTNEFRITYASEGAGNVELTVRFQTDDGLASDSATVTLPAAAPPTAPATTAPPPTLPASASPPPPPLDLEAKPIESDAPVAGLLIGAASIFTALLLFGTLVQSRNARQRRDIRAGLGLGHAPAVDRSVSQLTRNVAANAERMLEHRGRSRSIALALEVAGIALRPGEFVVLVLAVTLIGALGALALFGLLGLLAAIVVVPMAARAIVERRAASRRSAFAELLADNLQLLTSSLKAGHGLLAALDIVAQEAAEPTRSEFRRVVLEIRVGRDQSEALAALAARMESPDFEWVAGAIDINREIGGDLAQTLDNVAETIRERQRLARHVSALTAEGRLSAYVLTGIPIFLALAMSVLNPGYLTPMFSGGGLVLVAIGVLMLLTGWLWMKRLIRTDF